MKVAITGASGLIGTALRASLEGDGHQVLRIGRRAPAGPADVQWSPNDGRIDSMRLAGVDAFVNLAGGSIAGGRWTERVKREILESRIRGTRTLVDAILAMSPSPSVLVNA